MACVCRGLFPSSRCLFLYRDVVAFAKSLYRLSMFVPMLCLTSLLGSFSGQMTKMIAKSRSTEDSNLCIRLENNLSLGVFMYAVSTSTYLDMRRRGFDISGLRYEDLVERPLDVCHVLMEFCGLPVSLAQFAIKAIDVDSQRNSLTAKSVLGRIKDPQLTPLMKAQLNELLNKYGVPLIGEPSVLEGTLCCSY